MKPNIIKVLTLLLAVLFGSCNDQSDSPIYGRWRLEKYNSIATSSYGLTQVEKNENYVLQLDNTGVFAVQQTAIISLAILRRIKQHLRSPIYPLLKKPLKA